MPTPINPKHSSQTTSGHYDAEGGLCVDPTTQSPPELADRASGLIDLERAPSSVAVDQLVKSREREKERKLHVPDAGSHSELRGCGNGDRDQQRNRAWRHRGCGNRRRRLRRQSHHGGRMSHALIRELLFA